MLLVSSRVDFSNPNYLPIIKERAERLVGIRKDRSVLPALYKYYSSHPIDFIEDWMWTYDPRVMPSFRPFILWQKQKDYINWLQVRMSTKTDGLVEKSRDVGATWLNIAYSIWAWRYFQVKIGFGSRKEALVDRLGDPDSIFEKGRMILDRLPHEFLPVGYNRDDHSTHMKFINPEIGSTITGEAGDNIGRGGRSTIYFKDESAFYERAAKIEAALSQNSDVKIDVTTPNGVGNVFYQKRMSGKYPLFILDWKDDPRKNKEWYNDQVKRLDPIIVAQEIDRDYGGSIDGLLIPAKWVRAAINFPITPSGIRRAGLDVADEGADKNSLSVAHGSLLEYCHAWHKGNTTQTTRQAVAICQAKECFVLRYDKIGVGAGVKGELSNERYNSIIKAVGINSSSSPTPGFYELSGKKNEDMFRNLRAQMYWLLRRRFEKTYEHVEGIKEHPEDEMISIPNDPELTAELSQITYFYSENGKIQIESKDDMKKRGLKSPNKADSTALCFAPVFLKRAGSFGRHPDQDVSKNTTFPADVIQEIVGKRCGTFGRNKRMLIGRSSHYATNR